jgi:phosphate transport system substrate-binding protein
MTSRWMLVLGLFTLSGCAYWFDDGAASKAPAAAAKAEPTPGAETGNVVRLRGSTTVGSTLAPRLVASFLKAEGADEITTREGTKAENRTVVTAKLSGKPVTFNIEFPGSQAAFECLEKSTCDVGMSSRPVSEQEIERLKNVGDITADDSEHVLAMDGIAVVVNRGNKVANLTVKQVGEIFRREVSNWSQLGGAPGEIHLVSRDTHSGTYESFVQFAMHGQNIPTEKTRVVDDNEAVAAAVKQDPQAVGFVALPYVEGTRAVPIQDGDAQPVAPTKVAVSTESYAFSRRLFLYTMQKPRNPLAARFVSFALSDKGQENVPGTGFIALDVKASQEALPENAPDTYAKAVSGAQRLSFDFRFKGTTDKLEPKSTQDVDRLARFLRVASSKERSVALFGFTDGQKTDPRNVELSKQRAATIAGLLRDRGIEPQVVLGFGGVMPIAPNDSPDGRRKNRRVEVWVK